jgi:hypothetical protein
VIAIGRSIREVARLRRVYGSGRWRKVKGFATVRLGDGTAVGRLIDELAAIAAAAEASNRPDLGETGARVAAAVSDLREATAFMAAAAGAGERRPEALAGATPYLRLFGMATGGALLAKGALAGEGEPAGLAAIAKARFFAETMLGESAGLKAAATGSAAAVEQGMISVLARPGVDRP